MTDFIISNRDGAVKVGTASDAVPNTRRGCAGLNCGSTLPGFHSSDCYEEYRENVLNEPRRKALDAALRGVLKELPALLDEQEFERIRRIVRRAGVSDSKLSLGGHLAKEGARIGGRDLAVDPWDVLERMYQSEISGGLESDWDAGFKVWVGSSGWQIVATEWFGSEESDKIGPWLDAQVRKLWPESDYARNYPALSSNADESKEATSS